MEDAPSFVPFTGRTGPFAPFLPALSGNFEHVSGHGSPEGVVPGVPAQIYDDLDGGGMWMKLAGTQTLGWALIGASGALISPGGAANVFRSVVEPNGQINCTGAGIVIGDGALLGKLWVKSTVGNSDSDWIAVIA